MRPIFILTTAILICQLFMVSGEKAWLPCLQDEHCQFGACRSGFWGKCDNEWGRPSSTNTCTCYNADTDEVAEYLKPGFRQKNCEEATGPCKRKCNDSNENYVGYICNAPKAPSPSRRCVCLLQS